VGILNFFWLKTHFRLLDSISIGLIQAETKNTVSIQNFPKKIHSHDNFSMNQC